MLLYTTKFPVKAALRPDMFIDMVLKWVQGSPHYHFEKLQWEGQALLAVTDQAKLEILQFEDEKIIAVRLENLNNIQELWVNQFFFSYLSENNWVATQLFCQCQAEQRVTPTSMKLPYLLKQIQEAGFSGLDDNLPITNVPLEITEQNYLAYGKVLSDQGSYGMPVVYISVMRDGQYAIDAVRLAKLLSGTAHVLVEADLAVSDRLIRQAQGKKPYYGAVTIFFTKNHQRKILLNDLQQLTNGEQQISQLVYRWLLQFEGDERFSWYYWSAKRHEKTRDELLQKLQEEVRQKQADNQELQQEIGTLQEVKELQDIFDAILADKESELQQQKEQNYRLRGQLDANALERENRVSAVNGQPILSVCDEQDFYPDEQKDIVLDVLMQAYKALDGCSRRKDILASLLGANKTGGIREDKLKKLDDLLPVYDGMSKKVRSELQDVGFEVDRAGTHYILLFFGDSRYPCTMPKTPSDSRSGRNLLQTVIKQFF